MMINPIRRSLILAAATARALSTTTQADLAKVFRRRVLYEDNHVLAFDKPAGVLSQGDRTGDPCVADYAKAFLAEGRGTAYANPAHRLDRPVSGGLLVAGLRAAGTRVPPGTGRHKTAPSSCAETKPSPSPSKSAWIAATLASRHASSQSK